MNASDTEIKQAAEYSFANEFIENLPNKYETVIGENGIRLQEVKRSFQLQEQYLRKVQLYCLMRLHPL